MYEFKVRAENVYGFGPYSDVLYIQTGDRPDTMPKLTTRNQGRTNIQIKWIEPENNGYPIDDYKLEILNKENNRFESVFEIISENGIKIRESLCNEPSKQRVLANFECVISAQKVATSTYGYRSGDLLVARIAPHN